MEHPEKGLNTKEGNPPPGESVNAVTDCQRQPAVRGCDFPRFVISNTRISKKKEQGTPARGGRKAKGVLQGIVRSGKKKKKGVKSIGVDSIKRKESSP